MSPIRRITTKERQLFLTFDDGPCPVMTTKVLKILADCEAKATFFVITNQALAHPELVENILEQGHQIGDHSLDHNYRHFFQNKQHLKDWIQESHHKIEERFHVRPVGFRSPAGVITPPLTRAIEDLKIPWIHWNHRFFDTNVPIQWTQRFHSYFSGDILLFHDRQKRLYQKSFLVQLRRLVLQLKDKNFDFQPLNKEKF